MRLERHTLVYQGLFPPTNYMRTNQGDTPFGEEASESLSLAVFEYKLVSFLCIIRPCKLPTHAGFRCLAFASHAIILSPARMTRSSAF